MAQTDSTKFIHGNDSAVNKIQADTAKLPNGAIQPKKKKVRLGIAIGGSINMIPRDLKYSYLLNEPKAGNALIDFKTTPQLNFMFITKGGLINSFEAWSQSGNNVMDNIETGNTLLVTHLSYSITHLIAARTTAKFTIAPYAGLKFYYGAKDVSYLIKYQIDSIQHPLVLAWRRYSYNESSTLELVQLPVGATFMSKKIMVEVGASINLFGQSSGSWNTVSNDQGNYQQEGQYTEGLLGGRNMFDKLFRQGLLNKMKLYSVTKNLGNIPLLGVFNVRVGYLF